MDDATIWLRAFDGDSNAQRVVRALQQPVSLDAECVICRLDHDISNQIDIVELWKQVGGSNDGSWAMTPSEYARLLQRGSKLRQDWHQQAFNRRVQSARQNLQQRHLSRSTSVQDCRTQLKTFATKWTNMPGGHTFLLGLQTCLESAVDNQMTRWHWSIQDLLQCGDDEFVHQALWLVFVGLGFSVSSIPEQPDAQLTLELRTTSSDDETLFIELTRITHRHLIKSKHRLRHFGTIMPIPAPRFQQRHILHARSMNIFRGFTQCWPRK